MLCTLHDAVCGGKMFKEAQYASDILLYSSSNFLSATQHRAVKNHLTFV